MEEPRRLWSMWLQRVRHDWETSLSLSYVLYIATMLNITSPWLTYFIAGDICLLILNQRIFNDILLYNICFLKSISASKLMLCYAKSLQSCPTLCDPIDSSQPGSPIPGILQARTLEWVAISFSNAWKWKVKVKSLSRVRPSTTPWTAAYQAPPSMGFSRQEYWSGVPLPSLRDLGLVSVIGLTNSKLLLKLKILNTWF